MRPIFLSLALLAVAAPALAQDRPLMRPTRDVTVEYRSSGTAQAPEGGAGGLVTMRFTNKGARVRINSAKGHGYAILDVDAGRMTMVMTDRQLYLEQPTSPGMMTMFQASGATLHRTGSDTVAGVGCTVYTARVNDRDGEVCLTDDGLLLRARGADPEHQRELEAVKVTYEAQPASMFTPPEGFKKLDIPDMMGRPPIGPGTGR